MINKHRFSSAVLLLAFVAVGLSGCFSVAFSDSSGEERSNVLAVSTASGIRARFVVIDEISSVAVSKGLTPDTVALSGTRVENVKARYRVEITHPERGEVYSAKVKGKRVFGKWKIDPTEVKAPF